MSRLIFLSPFIDNLKIMYYIIKNLTIKYLNNVRT